MSAGFVQCDGGRAASGRKGSAGDCVCRAIAIASGLPYGEVYDMLAEGNAGQRRTKHNKTKSGRRSASNGIYVRRGWFKALMTRLGFRWVPTMGIGTGCKVHLNASELPAGRLVVAVSKHYTAVINGEIWDTYDPRREVHCSRPLSQGEELKPGEWLGTQVVNCETRRAAHSIQRRCVYGYWVFEGAKG